MTISGSSVTLRDPEPVKFPDDGTPGSFMRYLEAEQSAAMADLSERLALHTWGPPFIGPIQRPPWHRRLRSWLYWKRRSVRETVARGALWILRVDPRDITDE